MRIAFICAVLGLTIGSAAAQTSETNDAPTWEYSKFNNQYSAGETLKVSENDLAGNVSFSCTSKGQLYVSVWRMARTIEDGKTRRVKRRETKRVKLFINDVKSQKTLWRYNDVIPAISPADAAVQAALYNAAIRGDKVTLEFKKELPITLVLPKPNAAFAKFGANCGFIPIS